eukprot:scaffold295678_cov28-Tisochrysis_lutea.AAC.4
MPSVHSCVSALTSPYNSPMVMHLGLKTYVFTGWKTESAVPLLCSSVMADASTFMHAVLPPPVGPTVITPKRTLNAIVHRWHDEVRVQIANDTVEEGQVVRQKARHIGLAHGANKADILRQVRVAALHTAGHDQNGLYLTHAVVVVILLRKLL